MEAATNEYHAIAKDFGSVVRELDEEASDLTELILGQNELRQFLLS